MKRSTIAILLASMLIGCGGGGSDGGVSPSPDIFEDADGDGISTPEEQETHRSDPNDPHDPVPYGNLDHDEDGTPNGADSDYNPDADDDNDGLSNAWEYEHDLNPASPQILMSEERLFSVATSELSYLRLTLKTPAGDPISGAAFQVTSSDASLLRAVYPAKGWVSDSDGIIEEAVLALGTGRSDLYLTRTDGSETQVVVHDIDTAIATSIYNPADNLRSFSSVYNDSAAGSGNARSTLQSAAAWEPKTMTGTEWIELPIEENTRVSALFTQGDAAEAKWVSKLRISYEIAPGVREYANNGELFTANSDRSTRVRIPFNAPAGIDKIRVHPAAWFLAPAMRVGLEVSDDSRTAAIDTDSDNDGFSDLLEQRLGSDANDNTSPRLHNPAASERRFSSTAGDISAGNDGADGRIGQSAWRPANDDNAPWMNISIPADSKLVGVSLQGDNSFNRWTTAIKYANASVAGLTPAILDDEAQSANSDADSTVNQWLFDNQDITTLRLLPQTWSNGPGLRAALWLIDRAVVNDDEPLLSDADGDGLNALQEQANGLDDNNADSDNDGLLDGAEIAVGSDPALADGDLDGLDDIVETLLGSDPSDDASPGLGDNRDPDDDGLSSAFELAVLGTDPTKADSDDDGLSDRQESAQTLTDPLNSDSDGDTLSDSEESEYGSNANIASSPVDDPTLDTDGDGANDARELIAGSDAADRDSDNDGLTDGEEWSLGSDPLDADSPVSNGATDADGDGLTAAQEHQQASSDSDADNPLAHGAEDLDGDNTPNAADPDYLLSGDYDGDGIGNQAEYDDADDPTDSDSPQLGGGFDRDGDGVVNAIDTDFVLTAADDSDNDGLSDSQEYLLANNATNANTPLLAGAEDIDADSLVNNLDNDYDPLGDDDSDSWNNSFEYRAGTDPTTPNIAADFSSPSITLSSTLGSPIKKYSLPASGNNTPFYVANPHLLASVSISDSYPLETRRDIFSGFDSDDISYKLIGSQAMLVNNTARRIRNIGLRDSSTGAVTRVLGELLPFSRAILSANVANAVAIEPSPLAKLQLEDFQEQNTRNGSVRVQEALIDDYERLALGHKLMLNQPSLWQSYNDYSNSGCSTDICTSASDASEALAKLFYQEKPISHALLDDASSYSRLSWQNRQAQKADALDLYEPYHQARALSLGMESTSGMVTGFSNTMDSSDEYPLNSAAARGTIWTEPGAYFQYSSDAAQRTLRLTVYSTQEPSTLYAFSETPSAELSSLTYDGTTGEFVITLSADQWATGRLALALEDTDGNALPTMLLQWSGTPASWNDEPLPCAGGTDEPCHD